MDDRSFRQQIDRLREQWPTAYGDERIKLIAKYVRYIEPSDWKSIVDNCLSSFKFAPLPSDIQDMARKKYFMSKSLKPEKIMCKRCDDTTWIVVSPISQGVPEVKRCDCFN